MSAVGPAPGGFAALVEQAVVDGWFRDPPPFLRAMAAAPTRALARAFVLEWAGFSRRFPRWVGAIIANCPHLDVIAFEVDNLMSEVVRDPAAGTGHYELLVRLGVAAGLRRAEIDDHRPSPEAAAAFAWWWEAARQPDWLVGFAAVNGLELLGDRALPRRAGLAQGTGLAADVWATTGIEPAALEFFRVSDSADAEHGRRTAEVIATYTPPERESEILGVLGATIAQLRHMMDGMWALASPSRATTEA